MPAAQPFSARSDAERQPPKPPPRLGPYAIVRALGHGGMAAVYEGIHVGLGKRVALKVLRPHLAMDETTIARFVREGRAVTKVRHPHVVEVYDVGAHEGLPYLVMELLEGRDLSEHLKQHPRLSAQETIEVILPVVSAVAAAHDAGIVHRDLKPANIFLSTGRHGKVHPKVVDFGISTFTEKDGDLELTQTQTMLGTVRYMSPEQTRGAKYADARSDQYAIGVILYLCTTGTIPFEGEGVYEVIHAIRHGELAPPSSIVPSLSPAFDAVVMRALAREPAARFDSMADLGRELMRLAARQSVTWEREFSSDTASGARVVVAPPSGETRIGVASISVDDMHAPTSNASVSDFERPPRSRRALVASVALASAAAFAITFAVVPRRDPPAPAAPSSATSVELTAPTMPPGAPNEAIAPPSVPQGSVVAPAPRAKAPASPARASRPEAQRKTRPKTGSNGAPILE